MKPRLLIAIDGPAGAGKSTVAREVSRRLGVTYIDTGAMYRAIAWKILRQGIDISNKNVLSDFLASTSISFEFDHLFLDGKKLTEEIRTPDVSVWASRIAKIPEVRHFLVKKQQEIARNQSVVMDGRDIGTIVLPHADVKIFLTASIQQRAMRRYEELRDKGINVNIEDLQKEIEARDKADSTREIAPLIQAGDAICIDTTEKLIEEVINIIHQYCIKKTAN